VRCVVCREAFCNGDARTQFVEIVPREHRVDYQNLTDCTPRYEDFQDTSEPCGFICAGCVGRVVKHVDAACCQTFTQKCADALAFEAARGLDGNGAAPPPAWPNFQCCTGPGCVFKWEDRWCAQCTPNTWEDRWCARCTPNTYNIRARFGGGFLCPDCADVLRSALGPDQVVTILD
jgi:hypothetical protein